MFIKENATLSVSNPILEDTSKPITEALLSDIKIKEVRAIYPLVKAINSGRLTKNFTFYPAESLIGKNKTDDPSGYSSFVKPYGKPVLREHQAQKVMGLLGPIEDADVPMGRIVFSGFRRRQEKKDGPGTLPSKKYVPGTVEGDGTLYAVPAITEPEAITRVLGGAYHTVSIGSRVENVWEAISGKNIADIRRKGEELPPFERGQLYEGKLSYWRMGEIRGVELSFVNVPSDEYAGIVDPDIGTEGIRLLVAEKKSGKNNEYNFFDAKTAESVSLDMDEFVFDESFFVDSIKVGQDIWWLNKEVANVTEATEIEEAEYMCPNCKHESSKSGKCPECGTEMKKMKDEDEEDDESNQPKESVTVMTVNTEVTLDNTLTIEGLKAAVEFDKGMLTLPEGLNSLISKLVAGEPISEFEISNVDVFRHMQDLATEFISDWNEDAAKLAVALYIKGGNSITVPLVENEESNVEMTLGSLYLLKEDDESYNTGAKITGSELKGYSDECFCGPNRSYPVLNQRLAIAALRSIESYDGDDKAEITAKILEKAKSYGVGSEEGSIVLYPILVNKESELQPLFTIRSEEELQNFVDNLPIFAECYGLTDVQSFAETLSKAGDLFTNTLPESEMEAITLTEKNLVHYLLNSEKSDGRKELATLVGLVRKGKVTKEDLDESYEAYSVFGTSVLRKFMENVPVKPVENTPAEETETQPESSETPVVETIADPVEATDSKPAEDKNKESKDVWLGIRVRPAKRNGKHPVNIKEKR